MRALTRRDILSHQVHVPWSNQRQVEQDLLLCRAMQALFDDQFLHTQIAMRGGTLLHKVYLAPPSRYSEDIDLVIVGGRPEEHVRKAIHRVLRDILGPPKTSVWSAVALAIRNSVRPSRVLRMNYSLPSISEPGTMLTLVVEANATERKSHRPIMKIPFTFEFRGEWVQTFINGYDIHEMLGTKMRALFQRRRGRDLFDLYSALTLTNLKIDRAAVIESFQYYLRREGSSAGREEFIKILESHLADGGFCSDMEQLLRVGASYDPQKAGAYVKGKLLSLLPK